jgi:hypothetical protein
MASDRFSRILLILSIPVALLAVGQLVYEDGSDWSRVLHGHRLVLAKPVSLGHGVLALLLWSLPTVIVLAVVTRRKLWRSKIAIGAVACWGLFTAYSWAMIAMWVFYSG